MRAAVSKIGEVCKILDISSLYESKALLPDICDNNWDLDYLNAVLLCDSEHNPEDLFKLFQVIEYEMGRCKDRLKWSPRTIDIDILLCSALIFKSDILQIPHQYMHEREFVIIPACEIASDFFHPQLNVSIGDLAISFHNSNLLKLFKYWI